MPTIEEIRRANLALLRDEAGGVGKLAERVRVSDAQMSQWLNGSADSKSGKARGMRSDSVRKIELAMGKAPGWLDAPHALSPDHSWSLATAGNHLDQPVSHSPPRLEPTIRVPLLAVEASMGPGADLQGEDVMVGTLSLNPEWISSTLRPTRADALRFIHGYGDSMAPTFNSGDVLLVDSEARDVKTDGVYVLRAHERLFIKRVRQRLDGVYEISSDNPAHKTVDVLNGESPVDVVGRVIWVWNGRKM